MKKDKKAKEEKNVYLFDENFELAMAYEVLKKIIEATEMNVDYVGKKIILHDLNKLAEQYQNELMHRLAMEKKMILEAMAKAVNGIENE